MTGTEIGRYGSRQVDEGAYEDGVRGSVEDEARRSVPKKLVETLTPRQRDVFRRIAAGASTQEVAASLGLSVKTIETHRAVVAKKVGSRRVAHWTKLAIRAGEIELEPVGGMQLEVAEDGWLSVRRVSALLVFLAAVGLSACWESPAEPEPCPTAPAGSFQADTSVTGAVPDSLVPAVDLGACLRAERLP